MTGSDCRHQSVAMWTDPLVFSTFHDSIVPRAWISCPPNPPPLRMEPEIKGRSTACRRASHYVQDVHGIMMRWYIKAWRFFKNRGVRWWRPRWYFFSFWDRRAIIPLVEEALFIYKIPTSNKVYQPSSPQHHQAKCWVVVLVANFLLYKVDFDESERFFHVKRKKKSSEIWMLDSIPKTPGLLYRHS
jgi:hypothetical protein